MGFVCYLTTTNLWTFSWSSVSCLCGTWTACSSCGKWGVGHFRTARLPQTTRSMWFWVVHCLPRPAGLKRTVMYLCVNHVGWSSSKCFSYMLTFRILVDGHLLVFLVNGESDNVWVFFVHGVRHDFVDRFGRWEPTTVLKLLENKYVLYRSVVFSIIVETVSPCW